MKITVTQEFDPDDLLGYNNALKRMCYADEALIALGDIQQEIRSRLKRAENLTEDEEKFLNILFELTVLDAPEI